MKLTLFLNKSLHESAAVYYEQAKEARKKIQGLEKAIEETKKGIRKANEKSTARKKQVKLKRERRWYEVFNWFHTSGGRLAIGGRNAQQNDLVFSKHMEGHDLFFHADIQGATALILKDGINASEKELPECAQFAASFSNAWKNGNAGVDVYSVKKEQLSRHATGGYLPTGAFAISGKREWYKNTKLGLRVGLLNGAVIVVPENFPEKLERESVLRPSGAGTEKGRLARALAKQLGVHPDELLAVLPGGKTKLMAGK